MERIAEILSIEHEAILPKLSELEQGIADGNEASLREFIRFFREDMDFHGRKEEEVLYPELSVFSSPHHGLVVALLDDHQELHRLVEDMAHALDVNNLTSANHYGSEILAILPAHIHREETLLFPMADQVLDEGARARVRNGFNSIGSWLQ